MSETWAEARDRLAAEVAGHGVAVAALLPWPLRWWYRRKCQRTARELRRTSAVTNASIARLLATLDTPPRRPDRTNLRLIQPELREQIVKEWVDGGR